MYPPKTLKGGGARREEAVGSRAARAQHPLVQQEHLPGRVPAQAGAVEALPQEVQGRAGGRTGARALQAGREAQDQEEEGMSLQVYLI